MKTFVIKIGPRDDAGYPLSIYSDADASPNAVPRQWVAVALASAVIPAVLIDPPAPAAPVEPVAAVAAAKPEWTAASAHQTLLDQGGASGDFKRIGAWLYSLLNRGNVGMEWADLRKRFPGSRMRTFFDVVEDIKHVVKSLIGEPFDGLKGSLLDLLRFSKDQQKHAETDAGKAIKSSGLVGLEPRELLAGARLAFELDAEKYVSAAATERFLATAQTVRGFGVRGPKRRGKVEPIETLEARDRAAGQALFDRHIGRSSAQ